MNKLEIELANAQGALEVGLVAIVTPHRPLEETVIRTEKEWIIVFTCRPDDYLPQAARVPGERRCTQI